MKKIRQTRITGGLGGGAREVRVVEIEDDEPVPTDAVEVPGNTTVHDWQPEE